MCIKDHSRLIFVFGFDDSIASTNQHQCNRYQDDSSSEAKPEVLIQDRLKKGEERLDNAIEALELLCEPVEPPKGELEHIHYFCGNTEIPSDLKEREPQRSALYKATVALVRAYANIADELEVAGYSATDITRIDKQLKHYLNVREIILYGKRRDT